MEMPQGQRETRRRNARGAAPSAPMPVRRRSARHRSEEPEKPANVVFAPSDPYSAAMDDMPLKDLFPNMKVRKRSQQTKKAEVVEVPSPKSTESEESVRSKLRDSLAAALKKIESVEWEQDRGQEFKTDTERTEQEVVMPIEMVHVKPMVKVMSNVEGAASKEEADQDFDMDKAEQVQGAAVGLIEGKSNLSLDNERFLSKRIKLEDTCLQSEATDLAEKLAFDIEAELYRHFGGVNKKYKEKARSLLFNLKDRLNPELRLRVLAGEITPENLCNMNAEQLASKELSEWRMAKAEEFAQMVVLNEMDSEQPRLVKKTHKGEIEVGFEKEDVLTDVVTSVSQQRFSLVTDQQDTDDVTADVEPDTDPSDDAVDPDASNEMVCAEEEVQDFSQIRELNLTDGIATATEPSEEDIIQEAGEEFEAAAQDVEKSGLPAILSLDEFVGSKKTKEPKVSVKGDELDLKLGLNEVKTLVTLVQHDAATTPSSSISKDKLSRKPMPSPSRRSPDRGSSKNGNISQRDRKKEHRLNEKLWEGSFQLSGSQIPHVVALFKSGDGVELHSWPKLIEIKGRVRLDALEKFLQELRLSRTRAVMVIACRVDEGEERGAAVSALKEAANQYQRGERVGYAEPVPGYELYLFPGGGTSLKLLIEHGYLNNDQVSQDDEGILIGFVVCRRSTIPTSTSHKSSSHYFSANRHALSAQLDSPTRPSEIQWSGNAVKMSAPLTNPLRESENHSTSLAFVNLQGLTTNGAESRGKPQVQQLVHDTAELGSGLGYGKALPDWIRKESSKDDDADDDLPPGFGPKAFTRVRYSVVNDDDDDLPEYDFSTQNPAPLSTNIKASEVRPVSPFHVQTSYTQGSILPTLSQGRQSVIGMFGAHPEGPPFEQLNPSGQNSSQSLRPIVSHIGGTSDQARPSSLSSSQGAQQLHFHPMGPRPPPGPPPGPPFALLPPRPQLQGDSSFVARMPGAAQAAALHGEGSFNQSSQRGPTLPQVHDEQRTRGVAPLLQSHVAPISTQSSGCGQRKGGTQASILWDDDDMPEWCPPTLVQQSEINPRISVLQSAESGLGIAPRGISSVVGGGWQGMTVAQSVPSQGEGRGILQAPLPAMRYPNRASGSQFSAAKTEKYTSDRTSAIRPSEPRSFKGAK